MYKLYLSNLNQLLIENININFVIFRNISATVKMQISGAGIAFLKFI